MWTVVYMSKNPEDISLIKDALKQKGIITAQKQSDGYIEILVPSQEISLAHNIIIDAEI